MTVPHFKVTATFTRFAKAEKIIEAADLDAAGEIADHLTAEEFPDCDDIDGTIDIDDVEECDAPEVVAVQDNTDNDVLLMIHLIDAFDQDCADAQYTDTDDAWALLSELKRRLQGMAATPERITTPKVIVVVQGGVVQHVVTNTNDIDIGCIDYDANDSDAVEIQQPDTSIELGAAWIENHNVDPQAIATLWPIIEGAGA